MSTRFFFNLGDIPGKVVTNALKDEGIPYGLDSNAEYIIGYPDQASLYVYSSSHLYLAHIDHKDYAFQELTAFILALSRREVPPNMGVRRGEGSWPDKTSWPFLTSSYRGSPSAFWKLPKEPSPTTTKKEKSTMKSNRPVLFNVAAVFYPEYPEGAVVDLEKAEYPKVVLDPQVVLARSPAEAQTRVAGKVKEGYLDRADGTVEFFISVFGSVDQRPY